MRKYSVIGLLFFLFSGCWNKDYKNVDVSSIDLKLKILRLDKELNSKRAEISDPIVLEMRNRYNPFFDDYTRNLMGFGAPTSRADTQFHEITDDLKLFLNDSFSQIIFNKIEKKYANEESFKNSLEDALKHYQFYFPKRKITQLNTCVLMQTNEYGSGTMTYGDSALAVGLDMYLGADFNLYELSFPTYLTRKFSSEFITPNLMEVIYAKETSMKNTAELPLIEAMIEEGKKYYFIECMMPKASDSLIIGYTKTQSEWCKKSEKQIWAFFNDKDLLYKVNYMEQKRYTTDAPTTPNMPSEAPGKVGSWVGWQIVRKYMKENHENVSLEKLITKIPAKEILTKAKYKP